MKLQLRVRLEYLSMYILPEIADLQTGSHQIVRNLSFILVIAWTHSLRKEECGNFVLIIIIPVFNYCDHLYYILPVSYTSCIITYLITCVSYFQSLELCYLLLIDELHSNFMNSYLLTIKV